MPTSLIVSAILFVTFCGFMVLSEFRYRRRERRHDRVMQEHVTRISEITQKRKGSRPPLTRPKEAK